MRFLQIIRLRLTGPGKWPSGERRLLAGLMHNMLLFARPENP